MKKIMSSRSNLLLVMTTVVLMSGALGTPLDDYVNTFDPNYSYTLLSKTLRPGYTLHVLNMTSQKWLTDKVSNIPVWWHYVAVIVPPVIHYKDTGFVWVDGGMNSDEPPTHDHEMIAEISSIAVNIGTVCALIYQVPNQPIVFWSDPNLKKRVEDGIIAWTWGEFLKNGTNPEISVLLPMTKAVVRGLDTVSDYMSAIGNVRLTKFVISGASKRGWVSWLTAAVDKRIVGLVPIIMDMLSFQKILHHHFRSLGGWTFAYYPYYEDNITKHLDSPNFCKIQAIMDPFTYNDRYTMPKFIIKATGDEFFLLDNSYFYYDQLQGPKILRIFPDTDHSLVGVIGEVILAMQTFFTHIVEATPLPKVSWVRSQNETHGKIVVAASTPPKEVIVYHAHTTDGVRRDFRLFIYNNKTEKAVINPITWYTATPTNLTSTHFEAVMVKPTNGWTAFFIELKFTELEGPDLVLTTEANVLPDTYPYPDCSGESCLGTVV